MNIGVVVYLQKKWSIWTFCFPLLKFLNNFEMFATMCSTVKAGFNDAGAIYLRQTR